MTGSKPRRIRPRLNMCFFLRALVLQLAIGILLVCAWITVWAYRSGEKAALGWSVGLLLTASAAFTALAAWRFLLEAWLVRAGATCLSTG